MGEKSFASVTSNVKQFFEKFDTVFSGNEGIDCLFDKIDAAGGEDDKTLKKILKKLRDYHSEVYEDDNDFSTDETKSFSCIEIGAESSVTKVDSNLFRLQTILQDYLSHDIIWDGQKQCRDLICAALDNTINAIGRDDLTLDERETIYRISHVLCELIADCSISICGLIPLSKWNEGTEFYACLSAEDQLLSLLNKAILIDRMYLCIHSLKDIVSQINIIASGFYVLNWEIYYYIGFLNYKIHSYKDAINYFKRITCITDRETKGIDDKKWFHSHLLIAYCYEYQSKYEEAIEQLACPVTTLHDFIPQITYEQLTQKFIDVLNNFLKHVINNPAPCSSLVCEYFKNVQMKKEIQLKGEQLEIFHALAHCINEYAIDKRNEEKRENKGSEGSICYGKYVFFARGLMRFIANIEPEYLTCYATIHGECSDYSKALDELQNARKVLKDEGRAKETLIAEIDFFNYYFNQMMGIDVKEVREAFKRYCYKYSDNDAECHVKIFEFRNELRKYYSSLSSSLLNIENISDVKEHDIPPVSDYLYALYEELCKQSPSLYMNVNVRAELIKVQRAFICLKLYREYLLNQTSNKYTELLNAFNRFYEARSDCDLSERNYKDSPEELNIEKALFKGFSSQKSIVYCLHNTDSIFLLAPISGVVVFEYQTGKLNKLFDRSSFDLNLNYKEIDIETILNEIGESSVAYSSPQIKSINWRNLPEGIHVFCWKQSDAKRLVIAQKEKIENRQIIDENNFVHMIRSIIDGYKGNYKNKCRRKRVDNFGNPCQGASATIDWTEIINESSVPIEVLIYWKEENSDLKCFIMKSCELGEGGAESKAKCRCHENIYNARWDYSSDSCDQEDSIETSYDTLVSLNDKIVGSMTVSNIKEYTVPAKDNQSQSDAEILTKIIQAKVMDLTSKIAKGSMADEANKKRHKKIEYLTRFERYIEEKEYLLTMEIYKKIKSFCERIDSDDMNKLKVEFMDLLKLMGEK